MWNVVQCAARGRGHIRENTPCQDKVYSQQNDKVCAIALADGAGSATLSHLGAQCVVETICQLLLEQFESYFNAASADAVAEDIIRKLQDRIAVEASLRQCDRSQLASTLLAAAIAGDRYILIHLGDGVIGCLNDRRLSVVSVPDNGEFANTTTFVTSPNALEHLRIQRGSFYGMDGFLLMSDGAQMSFYDHRRNQIAPVLARIMDMCYVIQAPMVQKRLQESMDSIVIGRTQDDCSVVFCVQDKAVSPGYMQLSWDEKAQLLQLGSAWNRATIRHYDSILQSLAEGLTLPQAMRRAHIPGKYHSRYMERLIHMGFIEKAGRGYVLSAKLY